MNSAEVTALRIARRGERLTFLASLKDSKRERIFGYLDRPAAAIPVSCIRLVVHTGDPKLETQVVWKSIDVRADGITPTGLAEPARRGLLDSAIDFFSGK